MKSLILKIVMAFSLLLAPVAVISQPVYASCDKPANNQEALQCGACGANGQQNCGSVSQNYTQSGNTLANTVSNILKILSALIGVVSIVMILVGGFRYVTSAGKQESVSAAKNTILYAAVGLAIAALAQLIVHFVLNHITNVSTKGG